MCVMRMLEIESSYVTVYCSLLQSCFVAFFGNSPGAEQAHGFIKNMSASAEVCVGVKNQLKYFFRVCAFCRMGLAFLLRSLID